MTLLQSCLCCSISSPFALRRRIIIKRKSKRKSSTIIFPVSLISLIFSFPCYIFWLSFLLPLHSMPLPSPSPLMSEAREILTSGCIVRWRCNINWQVARSGLGGKKGGGGEKGEGRKDGWRGGEEGRRADGNWRGRVGEGEGKKEISSIHLLLLKRSQWLSRNKWATYDIEVLSICILNKYVNISTNKV